MWAREPSCPCGLAFAAHSREKQGLGLPGAGGEQFCYFPTKCTCKCLSQQQWSQLLWRRKGPMSCSARPASSFPGQLETHRGKCLGKLCGSSLQMSLFVKGKSFAKSALCLQRTQDQWWDFQQSVCVHVCMYTCVCVCVCVCPSCFSLLNNREMLCRPLSVLLGVTPGPAPNSGQLGSRAGCSSLSWHSSAGLTFKNFVCSKMFLSKNNRRRTIHTLCYILITKAPESSTQK
jgi:hypothetical protein